jgi:D-psicose/D-tagatose/L-ribulose 3-epimerase
MMYDSFHAHFVEKDQARAIASCAAETIHVHVSENDRGIPGTGQVHWDSFWSGLKSSGYDGYLTIECRVAGPYDDAIRKVVALIRETWERV